ncbi:hypothetical protein EX895_002742 [Sporisorium graminicola]|uniref:chorismate mutase n=1 Tax=Sporisorium graminicola TaxID=280036 RepID=A0A4U7KV45_9BASI|nr:hypothetical protein EX895_002742 [Sporisorium graminicola]TKY88390.1 hypothetical protein EX895_002742 [Sporisorium graminicola]
MKIPSFLTVFVLAAMALVHGVESAPADAPVAPDFQAQAKAGVDPELEAQDRLDVLRGQVQRYESPIVHTFLARAALGGAVPAETTKTISVLKSTHHRAETFPVPDKPTADWLKTKGGAIFDASASFPAGTGYVTPVVLARDAELTQGTIGGGAFPTGRRPQDPVNILTYLSGLWAHLQQDPTLDPAAVASLDASLNNLVSARVLLGYEIGLAKFQWQNEEFCNILTSQVGTQADPKKIEKQVTQLLTDNKVQVNLFRRVQQKANAYSKLFFNDPKYPDTARDDVLRLFQAYIVPVTTAIETEAVIEQAHTCKGYKVPEP